MDQNPKNPRIHPLNILCFSALLIFLLFIWQGHVGFSLWDEGFLWYGAQRVIAGEVPIRDFMAYDPGRYYWSAMFMHFLGDTDIMTLRTAIAVFQVLGLFTGLLLIARSFTHRSKNTLLFLMLSAAILILWMFPSHKLFDISLSIFLLGILTFLIEHPSNPRYFITGIGLGLIAVFGRNHALYGVVSTLGVMIWLAFNASKSTSFIQALLYWATGVLVGFTPMLLMIAFVPGFAKAFWESIYFLYEQKATNLPLPIPWPWKVDFSSVSLYKGIRDVLIGLFFIGLLAFPIFGMAWAGFQRFKKRPLPPTFVAAIFLALPYAHCAFSRAGISHLAQSIFPLLMGSLIFLSSQKAWVKWSLTIILFSASFWVMYPVHPAGKCQISQRCIPVEISGSHLQVDKKTVKEINLIRQAVAQHAPDQQNFIIAPFWPGAYSLFARKSPLWEIYALFPRSKTFEQKEIERLKVAKPAFALLFDFALDKREALRFKHTHPLIYQYILDHFEPKPGSHSSRYQIYTAKKE